MPTLMSGDIVIKIIQGPSFRTATIERVRESSVELKAAGSLDNGEEFQEVRITLREQAEPVTEKEQAEAVNAQG